MEVMIAIRSRKKPILKEDQMIVEAMLAEIDKTGQINVYWGKYEVEHPDPMWKGQLFKSAWAIIYRIYTTDEIGEYTQSIFRDMGYDIPTGLQNQHYLRRI
jgi:hypothetical protein